MSDPPVLRQAGPLAAGKFNSPIFEMNIDAYILQQPFDRQDLLRKIHKVIIASDKTVEAKVQLMMGKEMIVYNASGIFKYGLASIKNYMSLHVLPIYGSKNLHSKYKYLLGSANFQKGCINFKNEKQIPINIVEELILECSRVDLLKIKEQYLHSKQK